jgi:hypothetical protein
MKSPELSEFFSLIGQAKKEKEQEFDNLLKDANVDIDQLTTSVFTDFAEAKVELEEKKKKEEVFIQQLDTILETIDKPRDIKENTVIGVPEDIDISSLEEEEEEIVVEEEIQDDADEDTVAKAIRFIETQLEEELKEKEPDEDNIATIKAEVKELRNILYKVLAHGPGSGEVRLLRLDDVDTDDLSDGKILEYDASSEKLKFVPSSGISTTWTVDPIGISTTKNVGMGTTAKSDYALWVEGTARITGVLTIGQSTITLDPTTDKVTVGTGITLDSATNSILVGGSKVADSSGDANYSGIITAAGANFTGNVSVGGTLTYEDVTNVDAVGLITARNGINVTKNGINVSAGIVTASDGVSGDLLLTNGFISSATATTTSTSQQAIDSSNGTVYRSVKYNIQVTRGTEYHITEIYIVHNGTTAYGTEYAIIKTGSSLAVFETDYDDNAIVLKATPTSATSTVFKMVKTLVKV